MIRIRYSPRPHPELELEGSSSELADLRHTILECKQFPLIVPAAVAYDPSPYIQCLAELRFIITEGRIMISVQDQALCVSGRADLLAMFAENLPWDAEPTSPTPYHVHFERTGREEAVDENALGIVLTLCK